MHCTRTTQQNLDFLFPLAAVRDAITELSSHVAISGKKVRLCSVLFAVHGCYCIVVFTCAMPGVLHTLLRELM